jgi:amino acid transporter
MTERTESPPEGRAHDVQRLKRNAIGTMAVIFMAVATAAPITAMVGNVPIAVGFGNGSHAPAGYIVATVVLGLFAVGYSTMAKHITATGAFYGYISHGLGRIVGMASGILITMAYVVFEGSLIGIFSFFFQNLLKTQFGFTIHWIVPALLMLALNAILTYFDVNLAAKVLGVFLVTEILMLSLGALAVLVHGGGPDGFAVAETLKPVGAFQPAAIAGASAGLGLFFAFWSWVGFESTAMYGEESREPKKIIPRATMISVLGVGVFYVFISWMAIAGTGPQQAVDLARTRTRPPRSSSGRCAGTTASGRSRCSTSCWSPDRSRAGWHSTTVHRGTCTHSAAKDCPADCRRRWAQRIPRTAHPTSRRSSRVGSRW